MMLHLHKSFSKLRYHTWVISKLRKVKAFKESPQFSILIPLFYMIFLKRKAIAFKVD